MKGNETVRSEIIERIKSRDLALAGFCAGFAALTAGALKDADSRAMLLPVPFLALGFAFLAANHDSVVHYLHLYAKRTDEGGWDNSPELADYHASTWRWAYFCGQLLAFVGGSWIAMCLSAETPDAHIDPSLKVVWLAGCCATILTATLLLMVRSWRLLLGHAAVKAPILRSARLRRASPRWTARQD